MAISEIRCHTWLPVHSGVPRVAGEARGPPQRERSVSAEPAPGSARPVGRPWGAGLGSPSPGRARRAPFGSDIFRTLTKSPSFFFFFINCQCFFPLRTCSIWQQESTVGLAGTVVQSLEEFRIVTTHQNKLLSTDQNTKCCDSA